MFRENYYDIEVSKKQRLLRPQPARRTTGEMAGVGKASEKYRCAIYKTIMNYWAKTTENGLPGIDVYQHLLRVAFVAKHLAEQKGSCLSQFGFNAATISCLAGLHDIGKISQGFQSKCPSWLEQNRLLEESRRYAWQSFEKDHSKISQFTIQRLLSDPQFGLDTDSALWWAAAIGGHHGRLHYPGERGLSQAPGMCVDTWEDERKAISLKLLETLNQQAEIELLPVSPKSPEIWWVAGLTSVADWIGSDESYFPPDQELAIDEIKKRSVKALESIGIGLPNVIEGLKFEKLFPFAANPLQTAVMDYIKSPGVYVIEAPMGMGKTEAALAAAYQLLCSGHASGIYFALPTQATSNRIHERLSDFVNRICPNVLSTRLIHANSWLLEKLVQPKFISAAEKDEDTRQGRDWFASPKRALIAPFGVGTIDQALLSIVASKHFFVRRFALAGKVVIIDEVHSYDVYTGTLVGKLCEELEMLGCTVIILSATLTKARRNTLLKVVSSESKDDSYPLISGKLLGGEPLKPESTEAPKAKEIKIVFPTEEEALSNAVEKAQQGACILWVCNTVSRSQQIYRQLSEIISKTVSLGLIHSQFPFFQRQVLEEYWMSALGKEVKKRQGCILVSTQIVEQSVDLDADLMITELAPTDMLLQRMGRLWRHQRDKRPVTAPECWILREAYSPDEMKGMSEMAIKKAFSAKANVYDPYVLLRSLLLWSEWSNKTITLPGKIRFLLEKTYNDLENEPPSWLALRSKIEGTRYAERMQAEMNTLMFNPALPDDEGVQTRKNDFLKVSLILACEWNRKKAGLLNDTKCVLAGDDFLFATAKALHMNIVRVPKWVFKDFKSTEITKRYVRGEQAIVKVEDNGNINVPGLKENVTLQCDKVYGVKILRNGEVKNESCD